MVKLENIYCQVSSDSDDREMVLKLVEKACGQVEEFRRLFKNKFGFNAPILSEKEAEQWKSLGHNNKIVCINPVK